jgi:hypothetical protein
VTGKLLAYDCGSRRNWSRNDGSAIDKTWFLKAKAPGAIIRNIEKNQ